MRCSEMAGRSPAPKPLRRRVSRGIKIFVAGALVGAAAARPETWQAGKRVLNEFKNRPVARQTVSKKEGQGLDYRLPNGKPSLSEKTINRILQGSPMAGTGRLILAEATGYNVDPAVALAHFKIEGNFGRIGLAKKNKNPGNVRSILKGKEFREFASWQEGIHGFFWQIGAGNHYYKKGNTTAEKIVPVYAPKSENNTAQYLAELRRLVSQYRQMERQ